MDTKYTPHIAEPQQSDAFIHDVTPLIFIRVN